MKTSLVQHAKKEYRCKDCLRVIRIGELYYNRYRDRTIYCMECYEPRRQNWFKHRDTSSQEQAVLETLSRGSITARELHSEFGMSYVSLTRKLKMKGYPIGKRKESGRTTYYLVRRECSCQSCGRLFFFVPMDGESEPTLCERCSP